jgi:hypothetical protein
MQSSIESRLEKAGDAAVRVLPGQGEHAAEANALKELTGHRLQSERFPTTLPLKALKVPAGHGVAVVPLAPKNPDGAMQLAARRAFADSPLVKVLAGQGRQVEAGTAATVSLKVLGGHSVQAVEPKDSLYDPAGHASAGAPRLPKWPGNATQSWS